MQEVLNKAKDMIVTFGLAPTAAYLASQIHKDDVTKTGQPYFEGHILKVVYKLADNDRISATDYDVVMCAAYLHDVLEDHIDDISYIELKNIFGSRIAECVEVLTRRYEESYQNYCKRVVKHDLAKLIKQADLEVNLDIREFTSLKGEDVSRINKYLKMYHKYFT